MKEKVIFITILFKSQLRYKTSINKYKLVSLLSMVGMIIDY